ncbi:hypothetical protein B9Z19DRAFT_965966 [Tuber borchii]|uniref:Uncharacterized protein n=1 Tax=Tuber borchii TaxID=42251 RepID=A0A2T7A5C6_TUBBO|nr:hypothetical protein B9Z19DRAFT_965966 [Tuber borchii]
MNDLSTNSAPPEPLPTPKPSAGSTHQSSQPPTLAQESPDHFSGWKTIDEQQDFYNEKHFSYPSYTLVSGKLKDRKEDDVVIFSYLLSRADGNPLVEGSGHSSGSSGEDDDRFFQVSKDRLIESEQFNLVIHPTKEPGLIQSRARLVIIDFPQCYDTYDDNLLNSMAKELHLPNPTAFGGAHSKRVLALPGGENFRTGISLWVPAKKTPGLAKPGPSKDRITLFVSFPYFGRSSGSFSLSPESESVELLDFKRPGVDVPEHSAVANGEEKDDIGEILVHQARYMIFDNHIMATFRSKEDSAKDQVPFHLFQERIGAFHAMIHLIANRMELESWALGKLQASLCKLEGDIDRMISDVKPYEGDQGMRATRNIASFNKLSAALYAAINMAERQIAILQDLHNIFLAGHQKKTRDPEKEYPLRQNLSHRDAAPTPTLRGNPGRILPNALDTKVIGRVVQERKSFIRKVKGLVENTVVRRETFFGFLKSENAKAGPSEKTAQEVRDAVKGTEDTVKQIQAIHVQQGKETSKVFILTSVGAMCAPVAIYVSVYCL